MVRWLPAILFGGALLGAIGFVACDGGPRPPDVLLITVDTLRADRLGSYGYADGHTPHLDALAAAGTIYLECQAPTPITLPSHATLLTGLLPHEHGVRNNATYRLREGVPTLGESMQAAGYTTAAFVAAFPLAARFGLDRGFDRYDDSLPNVDRQAFHFRQRDARSVVRSVTAWLAEQPDRDPIFAWVHLFEPHMPYDLVPPFDQQFARAPYDGEVAAADAAIGELLRAWDSRRGVDRLTVVTADHGEGLGEHREASHSIFLYQTTLRVPLIFHWPDRVPEGARVSSPVGLVDVATTVTDLLGLESPGAGGARSLVPLGTELEERPYVSESLAGLEAYGWSPLFAARSGARKVIRSRVSRAYDLAADPHELNDVLGGDAPAWTDDLVAHLETVVEAQPGPASQRTPSAREREALGALGYVGGATPSGAGTDLLAEMASRPDATARIEEFNRTSQAEMHLGRGETNPALALLDRVLDENPDNDWARQLRARAYRDAGRVEEAIAAYSETAQRQPRWADVQLQLGRLYRTQARPEDARAHFLRAVALDPENVATVTEVASYLQGAGDHPRAADLMESTLRSDRLDDDARAQLHGGLARVYFMTRRLTQGQTHLDRARALGDSSGLVVVQALYHQARGEWSELIDLLEDPQGDLASNAEARALWALGLQMTGQGEASVVRYREALTLNQNLDLVHHNLAKLLVDARPAEALRHSQAAIQLAPGNPDYHTTHVGVLRRAGRDDAADDHLRRALEAFPGHPGLTALSRDRVD